MFSGFSKRAAMAWGVGLGMGLLLGGAALAGVWGTHYFAREAALRFPEISISASATQGGETFAMCTGPIDENVEGVFVLDYLTGDLQCAVVSPRTGRFNGVFNTNVVNDLGVEKSKKPKYLMVAGNYNGVKGTSPSKPALCLVYVLDENTGHFCAYGLPWKPEVANAGQPQKDRMILLDTGKARVAKIGG
jgi:hypothetical protein